MTWCGHRFGQTRRVSRFRYRADDATPPDTPEALFRDLRPPDRQVRDLYLRQGDVLRAYSDLDTSVGDVALELPTGAGKTLVGLLIAEWRRRALSQRVAYLCPTVQLARQAAGKAESYGLDVVTLVRAQAQWDETDWRRFVRGRAIAVSTYHAVFNSNPRLDSAQTLVLDDAHAGEGPVSDLWSVQASRGTPLYEAVLSLVEDSLPDSISERLADDDLEGRRRRIVDLISPLTMLDRGPQLIEAANAHADGHNAYALEILGDNVTSCLLYVSWQELLLRPLIAPTASHSPFADAEQRVYMSATLGASGELERAFGVGSIVRPGLPTRDDERGFGRRLFLMPGASESRAAADRTISEAIVKAGRAVLLAQSQAELDDLVEAAVPEGVPTVSADAIERDPAVFTATDPSVLLLANRYDGIDLPDQACRLIVMSGLPRAAHLQERFLTERLGATRVIAERIRTRLMQGAGRCTRNPQDFAAVILRGSDLLDFVSRDEELASFRPELQAEIEFGLDNSEQEDPDYLGSLEALLGQDEDWQEADDYLRRQAAERERSEPPEAAPLSESAALEIQAWEALWRGDTGRAIELAQRVVDALSGGNELRPYRVLWLYLGASWARALGEAGDQEQLELAEQLQADAEATSDRLPWAPRHPRRPVEATAAVPSERHARAGAQLARIGVRGVRFERALGRLADRLGSNDAAQFERGLKDLGHLLGFDAIRPEGEAGPDGAWRSGGLWLVWEAKTDQRANAPLAASAVRQAATHARWLEREGAWPTPDRAVTFIVSPRAAIDPAAAQVAGEERLVSTALVRTLASEVADAYRQVRGRARALDDLGRQAAFAEAFAARRLDTSQLLARLSERRIAAG